MKKKLGKKKRAAVATRLQPVKGLAPPDNPLTARG